MSSIDRVRFGTPSAEEWGGRWRYDKTTPPHDSGEFDRVSGEFERRLATLGKVGIFPDCDFGFVGDDFGDRTQELCIVNPNALSVDLLRALQGWLREPAYRLWRIVTVNYLGPDGAIMIYPSVIRTSRRYGDDLSSCVEDVRKRRLAGEQA